MKRVPIGDLSAGLILARAVYSERGDLLLNAGVALSDRYIQMLRSRGFAQIQIEDPDTADVEIIDIISERVRLRATQSVCRIVDAIDQATRPFRHENPLVAQQEVASGEFGRSVRHAVDYDRFKDDIAAIVDDVMGASVLSGIATLRSFDNYLFLHSLDSTVVAVMIGKRLGLDRERLRQLAAGCILHDLGMVMVDRAIAQKPGRLNAVEIERVRQHAALGYEMLRQIRPSEVIPNHVAFQHHEHQDGFGYPRGLYGNHRVSRPDAQRHDRSRILLDAEICAVADVHDALGADRPFRPALPPDQVVRMLRGLAGTQLNREIVANLLAVLPVYPLGTEVLVQTGPYARHRGVVCRVDRESLDKPVVRVLSAPDGARITPIEIDLRRDEAVISAVPLKLDPAAATTA